MSNAPVCHVNLPQPQPQPANTALAIPQANAQNVVQVVNMITAALRAMSNQNPINAGVAGNGHAQVGGVKDVTPPNRQGGGQNGQGQQSGFQQTSVQISEITVTNPEDQNQFVKVQQITSLSMKNPVTGETWTFTAPSGVPGSGS